MFKHYPCVGEVGRVLVVVIYALMVCVSCEWTEVCLHVTAAVFNRDSELIFFCS